MASSLFQGKEARGVLSSTVLLALLCLLHLREEEGRKVAYVRFEKRKMAEKGPVSVAGGCFR